MSPAEGGKQVVHNLENGVKIGTGGILSRSGLAHSAKKQIQSNGVWLPKSWQKRCCPCQVRKSFALSFFFSLLGGGDTWPSFTGEETCYIVSHSNLEGSLEGKTHVGL